MTQLHLLGPAIVKPTSALRKIATGALARLHLRTGKLRNHPRARSTACRAALGFPCQQRPRPAAPEKPERDCDCVPWDFV